MDRGLIQTVRDRVDLVELVGQYVPLRRVGSRFVARCPFHQERTASFSVSAEQGVYHCFGCKASGDAFRFYAEMEGLTFPEALRALAERAGVEVPETRDPERIAEDRRQRNVSERLYAACEAAAVYFERCLADEAVPFSALARLSLVDRGISEETARAFRLGYAPARWDGLAEHLRAQRMSPADAELAGLLMPGRGGGSYDRFRHRLMFPVLDKSGRVVAFSGRILPSSEEIAEGIVPEDAGKYINSPETPLYRKGELLFGLANARMSIRQKQEALLVEGNFDVVQMHHGFTKTVAPLGTSFTEPRPGSCGASPRRWCWCLTATRPGARPPARRTGCAPRWGSRRAWACCRAAPTPTPSCARPRRAAGWRACRPCSRGARASLSGSSATRRRLRVTTCTGGSQRYGRWRR